MRGNGQTGQHLLLAGVVTVFSVILIMLTIVMSWELWMVPLIMLSNFSVWFLHIGRLGSGIFYESLCAGLLMIEFFFFGVHRSSLFDMPAVACVMVLVLFMLDKKRMLYIIGILYVLGLLYHYLVLRTITYNMETQDLLRLGIGGAVTGGSVLLARYWINRRREQRKRYEGTFAELETAGRQNAVFLSNVSHELKTPLASMKVLADSLLVQEDAPVELYQEFMQDIAEEIDRENTIISDLLTLVKTDRKVTDLNVAATDVNEFLEQILKRLRPIAEQANIEMVFESNRSVSAEIDTTRLSLAFSNLVENAIKYNRENGWVRVSLDADHKFFYVKVSDSGMGIPQDSLDYIFERFYRVDKSHSREIGGTGLGLAITKSAVVAHRGAIRVQSEMEQGTTFTVRIPLKYII